MHPSGRNVLWVAVGAALLAGIAIGLWLACGRQAHRRPPWKRSPSPPTPTTSAPARWWRRDQGYQRAPIAGAIAAAQRGKQALGAVLSNKADMATVADIPIVFAALSGTPVQIFGTIFRTGGDHGWWRGAIAASSKRPT
jgi:NitT/TauT family transport system substrate-binding protein